MDGGGFSRPEASHPRNALAFPRAVRSSEYGRLRGDTSPFAQSAAATPAACPVTKHGQMRRKVSIVSGALSMRPAQRTFSQSTGISYFHLT